MAPRKKTKTVASTSNIEAQPENLCLDFITPEANNSYRSCLNRKVIPERGICNKPPFDAYIKNHGWQKFAESPVEANISMSTEFYANMRFIDKECAVLCRGKWVRISADIINEYFGLEPRKGAYKEYNKLKLEFGIDEDGKLVGNWREIVRTITLPEYPMDEILPNDEFAHIQKKYLTVDMNVWYNFIAARLLPVTINSQVQWERIRMLYAFKKNIGINVGYVILSSMDAMLHTTLGWGFHSLITGLCHRAGCEDRADDRWKKPMGMLNFEAFQRRQKPLGSDGGKTVRAKSPMGSSSSDDTDVLVRVERIETEVQHIRLLTEKCFDILTAAFPTQAADVPTEKVDVLTETADVTTTNAAQQVDGHGVAENEDQQLEDE